MKNLLPLISLLLLCLLSACRPTDTRKVIKAVAEQAVDTAGYKSRTIATENFVSVEATCFADITYHQIPLDSPACVVLQAPGSILDDCSASVVDGTLRLALNRNATHPEEAVAVVHIYAPAVCDFSLVGGKCLRGDWAIVGLYALFCILFLKIFGGFKVGYLRNMDALYGQALAILFQNAVSYLQLSLLGLWRWAVGRSPPAGDIA